MYEMGIESSIFKYALNGSKTIEVRLRTPKFVTIRRGDTIQFREDTWENDRLVTSVSNQAKVIVTQTQFFDTFEALFADIAYLEVLPNASDAQQAITTHKQFYTDQQISEHGLVAIHFKLKP